MGGGSAAGWSSTVPAAAKIAGSVCSRWHVLDVDMLRWRSASSLAALDAPLPSPRPAATHLAVPGANHLAGLSPAGPGVVGEAVVGVIGVQAARLVVLTACRKRGGHPPHLKGTVTQLLARLVPGGSGSCMAQQHAASWAATSWTGRRPKPGHAKRRQSTSMCAQQERGEGVRGSPTHDQQVMVGVKLLRAHVVVGLCSREQVHGAAKQSVSVLQVCKREGCTWPHDCRAACVERGAQSQGQLLACLCRAVQCRMQKRELAPRLPCPRTAPSCTCPSGSSAQQRSSCGPGTQQGAEQNWSHSNPTNPCRLACCNPEALVAAGLPRLPPGALHCTALAPPLPAAPLPHL